MLFLAALLHHLIGLPLTRRHRCIMYGGVTTGLALAALDPIRRTLQRRSPDLRSPLAVHAYYLSLALAADFLLWDPATRFGAADRANAWAILCAAPFSVTLFRLLRHRAGALGLFLFWSTEASSSSSRRCSVAARSKSSPRSAGVPAWLRA